MRKNDQPAAYQGRGWQPREGSMSQDILDGKFWSTHCSNSEWGRLKAVLLYLPAPNTPEVGDVNTIQHLQPTNYELLNHQMQVLCEGFEQQGVTVHLIRPEPVSRSQQAGFFYNLIYVRDLFFMTPEGAILARMASKVRAGEELHVARALVELGIPISRTIGGTGTFEGADALWVNRSLVLVGTGDRTNQAGFQQVKSCLEAQGISAIQVALPAGIQHLLGLLQIVDKDLAFVRGELVSRAWKKRIADLGLRLIEVAETEEIQKRQAMNLVTVAPRKIVMVGGNPATRQFFEANGLEVVFAPDVDELLKGAGGIGCATGILHRQFVENEN